jgi:molybdopterin-guanine dinucleotide biosynthesis adapter protein
MPEPPIFGVTGWKNTGKTTLLAALVTELTARGLRISTVKHAHHVFDVDHEGRDSWKHRKAGANETLVSSGRRWALMHELGEGEAELTLDEIVARLSPCDLVLVEGYKRDSHPKIELLGATNPGDAPMWRGDPSIVALACESRPADCPLPVFARDDIASIASYITRHLGIHASRNTSDAAE